MDNFYNDERISSYLDGELSADEQARFEERLAESAELRQLVEELRALRGSLDLLPRYQLEPDFAERVLRRAEQQMLVGGEGGSSGGAFPASGAGESSVRPPAKHDRDARIAEQSHPALHESRRWRRRIVRPIVYAGAAIAAAILIMVFTPPGGNEVAQNRPGEQAAKRGDVAAAAKNQRGPSGFGVESNKAPAQPNSAGPQVASQPNDAAKDSKHLGYAREKESAPNNLSLSTEDRSRQQAGRNLAPLNESLAGTPASGANNFSDRDSLTESRAISAKPDRTDNAHFGKEQLGNKPVTDQPSDNRLPENGRGVAVRSTDGYATNGSLADRSHADGIRPYGNATDLAEVTELLRRNLNGAVPADMIVANCEVAPETANRTFFALLEKHAISVRGEAESSPLVTSQLMDQISGPAGSRDEGLLERAETASADKLSGDKAPGADGRRSNALKLESAPAKKAATDFEVVYVEGSPQQINGLVSDLDADPAEFRSFELRSAPAAKLSIPSQADSAPSGIDAMKDLEARDPAVAGNRPTAQAPGDDPSMTRKRETSGLGGGGGPAAAGTRPGAATAGGTSAGGASNGNSYSYQAYAPAHAAADRPPPDANAARVPVGTLGTTQESHGLQQKQAGMKGAPSGPNDLGRTADKSPPADVNAPTATEGAAKTGVPPTPAAFGGAKAGPELHKPSEQFYAQKAKDTPEGYQKNEANNLTKHIAENAPPAPAVQFRTQSMTEQELKWSEIDSSQQVDRGKGEQGQSSGFAFWLFPVPAEVKQELSKERGDGIKFAKKKVENGPAASSAAAGLTVTPKSAAAAPSTAPAGAAAPAFSPPAEPGRPVAVKGAPINRAADEPAERSAMKSAKEPVPAGAGKPAAEKPADEKAGAVAENSVKLRAQTNDNRALPAAMPQTPPSPHDGEQSFRRGESLAVANGDRATESSPRMRAIFIFRIAPQPAAAAPRVEAGPAPAGKAK